MEILKTAMAGTLESLSLIHIFMTVNMAVSFMALWRSDERSQGVAAEASWQQVMDERFGDERLARIYPNAIKVE